MRRLLRTGRPLVIATPYLLIQVMMAEQEVLEFKPYVWLRAINRSDLPKNARDVLRMLAVEMKPGEPSVKLTYKEQLEFLGSSDGTSLKKAHDAAVEGGYLEISKPPGGNVYTARFGAKRTLETRASHSGNQSGGTLETRASHSGNQSGGTLETRASHSGNQSPTSYKRDFRVLRDDVDCASEREADKLTDTERHIFDLLKYYDREISKQEARELAAAVGRYQDEPAKYIESRFDDGILARIHTTKLLLEALVGDSQISATRRSRVPSVEAAPAEASCVGRAADDEPDPPTDEPEAPDDYEHPTAWVEALEQLSEIVSGKLFASSFEPLRVEIAGDALVVWCTDELNKALIEKYVDLIEDAVEVVDDVDLRVGRPQ